MSASPSKAEGPHEEDVQSPETEDKEQEQPAMYEFEVKEQDRWLPIANGEFLMALLVSFFAVYTPLCS